MADFTVLFTENGGENNSNSHTENTPPENPAEVQIAVGEGNPEPIYLHHPKLNLQPENSFPVLQSQAQNVAQNAAESEGKNRSYSPVISKAGTAKGKGSGASLQIDFAF